MNTMSASSEAILLDTNLLVLLSVGLFDLTLVGQKRLKDHAADAFELLAGLVGGYPAI